jgi:Trypsin Inhibitor like cysteine rich domain
MDKNSSFLFSEEKCPNDRVPSDCANDCETSCDTLTCDDQCQKPEKCVPGCVCPGNKVIGPDGQCIHRKECPCRSPFINGTLVNGESNVKDPCKNYTCENGCLKIKEKNCLRCNLSDWTPFSACSNACNGTQFRFRTYDGPNCPDNRTDEEKRSCSSNCTVVCYQTTVNGSVVKYNVGDQIAQTRCNRT